MADDGDHITLAARLDLEDAEAGVLVVEGDPLDEAGEILTMRFSHPLSSQHARNGQPDYRIVQPTQE
jgi:hypothetical protein